MRKHKGFTLIELLLVISIILIVFLSWKGLFQTPNRHMIDSEVCINNVYGKLSQFFYQGITGKDIVVNGEVVETNSYGIQIIKTGTNNTQIEFIYNNNTWERNTIPYNSITLDAKSSNTQWCNTNVYSVVLSWADISNIGDNVSIILNKNLNNTLWNAGMKICKNYDWTWICSPTTLPFTSKVDFSICLKNSIGDIDLNSCRHTFSIRFDTATQSIKSNKCLNILYDTDCKKWAIDNF